MALEGANIAGQAQVYNQTQKAVDVYAKTLAQQQARLAAEQKALQDDLSKVKVEGVRQGDMPEFLESYNKSKDIFNKLNATRNPSEKIRLKREFDESMLNTAAVGADSRELAKGEDAAAKMFMNPNIRDRYKPEAVEQFQLSKSLSRKDPRYVRDLSTLEQQIDASSTMSELDKIKKSLLDAVKPSFVQRAGKLGNDAGTFVSSTKSVTPKEQIFATSLSFDVSPKLRAGLRQMYKQYEDLPDDQFKAIVIPDWVSKNPAIDYSEEKFVPGMSEYQRRSLALRESEAAGGGAGINAEIVVRPKNFIGKKLPLIYKSTGKPILNEDGTTQKLGGSMVTSEFPVYSAVNPTAFAMSQVDTAFDIDKGINRGLEAGTYKLTGIGYNIVKGGKTQLRATIMDEDDNEYVINPSNLPADIRGDKYYKKVIKAVEDEWAASSMQPKAKVEAPAPRGNNSEEDAIFKLIKEKNVARGVEMTDEIIKEIKDLSKEFSNTKYEIDGKTYTYTQLAKMAKGSRLSAEEYVKSKGGKVTKPNKGSEMSVEDSAALNWANSNPKDPRAKAIKDKLKADKKI
jgi:hypothetical protein